MMPAFAVGVFDRGADGLATLLAASGLGGLVVSVAMSVGARERWLVYVLAVGEGFAAAAMILFTATDIFWIGVPMIALVGALASAAGIASSTLIQLSAEPAFRGRVISVSLALFIGAPALGSLILGTASEWLGPRFAFAVAGTIVVATACLLGPKLVKRRGAIELSAPSPRLGD
jgi:predicted MFS family arabinose efflux permease